MWECPYPLQLDPLLLSLKPEAFSDKFKGSLFNRVTAMLKKVCLCLLSVMQVKPASLKASFQIGPLGLVVQRRVQK